MEAKRSFKGYTVKIVFRAALIGFLLLGMIPALMAFGYFLGGSAGEEERELEDAYAACEHDYYSGEYAALFNTLELYDVRNERLSRFQEAAEFYEAWQKWRLYRRGAGLSDIDEAKRQEYETKAAEYEKTVRQSYENCTDSENRSMMKKLLEE